MKNISISDEAQAIAEKRAEEQGFDSIESYLDALVAEDQSNATLAPWMRARLEEGVASPSAGPLTRKKLHELVQEGIDRAI